MDWNPLPSDEKARDLLNQAGDAASRSAHVEANTIYGQALQLAEGIGDWHTVIRALIGQAGLVGWVPGESGFERRGVLAQRALDLARAHGDRAGEAAALRWLSSVAPHAQAGDMLREARRISEEIGDKSGTAAALTRLSNHMGLGRKREEARECNEQAAILFREVGDRRGLASAVFSLLLKYDQRDPRREACALEAKELYASLGDEANVCRMLDILAVLVYEAGDPRAEACNLEELEIQRRIGDPERISTCLHRLADNAAARGDQARAEQLHAEADALYREPEPDPELMDAWMEAFEEGDVDTARDKLLHAVHAKRKEPDEA